MGTEANTPPGKALVSKRPSFSTSVSRHIELIDTTLPNIAYRETLSDRALGRSRERGPFTEAIIHNRARLADMNDVIRRASGVAEMQTGAVLPSWPEELNSNRVSRLFNMGLTYHPAVGGSLEKLQSTPDDFLGDYVEAVKAGHLRPPATRSDHGFIDAAGSKTELVNMLGIEDLGNVTEVDQAIATNSDRVLRELGFNPKKAHIRRVAPLDMLLLHRVNPTEEAPTITNATIRGRGSESVIVAGSKIYSSSESDIGTLTRLMIVAGEKPPVAHYLPRMKEDNEPALAAESEDVVPELFSVADPEPVAFTGPVPVARSGSSATEPVSWGQTGRFGVSSRPLRRDVATFSYGELTTAHDAISPAGIEAGTAGSPPHRFAVRNELARRRAA